MSTNYRQPTENMTHFCYKANRICLNSLQNNVNISDKGVSVTGAKVLSSGYVNASKLPKNLVLENGFVHTYYIDLKEDLKEGMNIKITIPR